MEQKITQMVEKFKMSEYDIGPKYVVNVPHINTPRSFYIRLESFKDDVALLEQKGEPLTEADAVVGKRVMFQSRMIGKYVRGDIEYVVNHVRGIECNMFAIDYGFRVKQVPLQYIFLPKYDIPCDPMTVHCQLYLCEPRGQHFDQSTIEAMKYFVGSKPAKMTVKAKINEKLVVELKTVESPNDVATTLALLNYTMLTEGGIEVDKYARPTVAGPTIKFKYKEFKVGDELQVRVQSGDSINSFYVADENEYNYKVKNAYKFVEYCKRRNTADVPAALAEGCSCGVRVNQSLIYERAIVKKITVPDTKALVQLVDWGNEIEVNFSDIKKVNTAVYTIQPAVAIYCSSTEDQMWDNGFAKFLHPGWSLIIKIMELGNGIDIPHKVNMSPCPPESD